MLCGGLCLTNFPQTKEVTWLNSETIQPNKKVQLPNLQRLIRKITYPYFVRDKLMNVESSRPVTHIGMVRLPGAGQEKWLLILLL